MTEHAHSSSRWLLFRNQHEMGVKDRGLRGASNEAGRQERRPLYQSRQDDQRGGGWGGERRGGLQGKKNKTGDKNSIELGTPRALM